MAVTPLHRHSKVKRMVVSTYQAASGAGAAAMRELELQTKEVLEGKPPTTKIFSRQDTAREVLKRSPGLVVIDDRTANNFPTPLEVSNKDDVAAGRIRRDVSQEGNYGLDIFVCGGQIREGAALNVVQIAEMLI